MSIAVYRPPKPGDENQISGCMWASANLPELTDGTAESVAEWLEICDPAELKTRILSGEKTLVATWNDIVIGFIAFKRVNHLSLLFVRKEFSGQGIGRQLFTQCTMIWMKSLSLPLKRQWAFTKKWVFSKMAIASSSMESGEYP